MFYPAPLQNLLEAALHAPPHLSCVTTMSEKSRSLPHPPSGQEPLSSDGAAAPHSPAASGESWVALCAQAAVEQDPKRLLVLVKEINRLLDARRQRLTNEGVAKPSLPPQQEDGKDHDPD
jgi:hypothetical protein